MQVRKAVFPVAGLGTRFLPATKASPKEMLPVVDKPIIQYAVEEAISAGITELIFVTSITKRSIEDHFDSNYELEDKLDRAGKQDVAQMVREIIPRHVTCAYIRQPEALGLGHAVLCAKPLVGDEPFAVLLADDMIYSPGQGCLSSMVELAMEKHSSVIAVEQVKPEEVSRYGIIEPQPMKGPQPMKEPQPPKQPQPQEKAQQERVHRIQSIVEKPDVVDAPSNLAAVGRYVLVSRVMSLLEKTRPGAGGEIQLTDAISDLLEEQRVLGYQFEGKRYDCGSKLGYLQATVEYGLRHKDISDDFRRYIEELVAR